MTKRHWTLLGIVLFAGAIAGWDIHLATDGFEGNTISELVLFGATVSPLFVSVFSLCVGVLLGHFLWPQKAPAVPEIPTDRRVH